VLATCHRLKCCGYHFISAAVITNINLWNFCIYLGLFSGNSITQSHDVDHSHPVCLCHRAMKLSATSTNARGTTSTCMRHAVQHLETCQGDRSETNVSKGIVYLDIRGQIVEYSHFQFKLFASYDGIRQVQRDKKGLEYSNLKKIERFLRQFKVALR
jgi:hypothetical protein